MRATRAADLAGFLGFISRDNRDPSRLAVTPSWSARSRRVRIYTAPDYSQLQRLMIPHARQRFNPRVYRAGTFERSVRSAHTCDPRADQYRQHLLRDF